MGKGNHVENNSTEESWVEAMWNNVTAEMVNYEHVKE